ncbi:MAG: glycosyltransferase family 2 protein [Thermoguttaceae bacterium]|jgi:glycosyltransferase involved in cell wall biosynthesis|nr:glycosyltransferase family 2 protein [Thermoguttaceae bacterium]
MNSASPSLSIVIPALNEEEAIGSTIARCLDAVEAIRASGVASVEILVVNDGSTDRTSEIARSFEGVQVIDLPENRGYGAALQEGFRRASGTLLGFLDADGTCDPRFFAALCGTAIRDGADMVLGSRLGPGSHMPAVRKFGNRCFALLLGFLCGRPVCDTASGMRVLRREVLEELYPLPNGLHFTPSMSARALLNGLRVVELPMPYHERIGRSKLRLVSDGLRFLRVILSDVLCYRPERLFLLGFAVCLLVGVLLAAYPVEFYVMNRSVEEWMIYRFMICGLVGSAGYQLLAGAALTHRLATFGPRRRAAESFWASLAAAFFAGRGVWALGAVLLAASALLLWPAVVQYATTGEVTLHWSRFMTAVFGLLLCAQSAVAGVLVRVVDLWRAQVGPRGRTRDGG